MGDLVLAPTPTAPRSATRRSPWWVEAVVVVWLCWVYDAVANLAPLRQRQAVDHALGVLRLESRLHLDPEGTLDHWLAGHHSLGWWVGTYYDNAHFAVTFGVLGWLWWRRPDIYRPLRNALVLINVAAFAVFLAWPMAPPRLLPGGGFVDVVAASGSPGSWHTGTLATAANQLAAMPSLHMAWALWSAWAAWRALRGRRSAALVWGYPLLTAVVVLATGNHFVADIAAGAALTALTVPASDLLSSRHRIRRSAPRARPTADRRDPTGALADAA